MSIIFVDPRTDPDPQALRAPARFTSDRDELTNLHRFCREARLYDVEQWLQEGRPLQLEPGSTIERQRRLRTALEIALDRQDYSLVLLLIANGYDWTTESEHPLDTALRLRRRDLLDLFLDWGADPQQISVDSLCDTYDSELYERFRSLGVDLTSGHALAYGLGYHTSNKPLFGFAKRHRLNEPKIQTELDIALAHHAWERHEKGVMLCLWAGANPHASVPDLRWGLGDDEDEEDGYSAVYAACSNGHTTILGRLQPDPTLDNYEDLFRCARNGQTVELLARAAMPKDPSRIVIRQLGRAGWYFREDRPVDRPPPNPPPMRRPLVKRVGVATPPPAGRAPCSRPHLVSLTSRWVPFMSNSQPPIRTRVDRPCRSGARRCPSSLECCILCNGLFDGWIVRIRHLDRGGFRSHPDWAMRAHELDIQ